MKATRKAISSWLNKAKEDLDDEHIYHLCEGLITFLSHDDSKHLRHITFSTLHTNLQLDHQPEAQVALLKVTDYLSSNRLHLLDMKFQLFDAPDEDPIELSDDDVECALFRGALYNPNTGEPVTDFKEKMFPYFEPSKELMMLHGK